MSNRHTVQRIALMHHLLKEKPEAERNNLIALKYAYPNAFKYIVIIPFVPSKSTDMSELRRAFDRRVGCFLKFYNLLSDEDKLDCYDDLAEFLFEEYGTRDANLGKSTILKLLNQLTE